MGPKIINWGILGPGGIAKTFTKDLLVDPKTRGVTHLQHSVAAVASSSNLARAEEFLKDVGAPASAKAYGSYQELVSDTAVEIVYVATPHSHHFEHVLLCLKAGKNVLCEKPITVNAEQAKILVKSAREKNLFLMEGVWTRYLPISAYVREIIASNRLGPIQRVLADTSIATSPETSFADGTHRLVNLDLAGGSLLDLGIYSLSWIFDVLYTGERPETRKAPEIQSFLKLYHTGSDESATVLLNFPRSAEQGGDAHAIAFSGIRAGSDPDGKGGAGPALRVFGEKGEIQLFAPLYRPTRSHLVLSDGTVEDKKWPQPGPGIGSGWYNGFAGVTGAEGEGHGMFWEADEVGDALVNDRKEGRLEGLDETVLILEVMDTARKQAGLVYPDRVESVEYPVGPK
ncbi:hypothetical protein G7Y89_g4692 [Cudoniella acicularis]|uniref:D-xylose 1-dehydrogenase (NADP(+), D-xylono-1,5-lactone-forming) n=1 Tax=Cudoniella acicularis TaxID=354080 RepID=A0A8H4RNX7_9HELO|nr:hypothetical protein G7Y89_g4692 [Cudoniella acicularis]